MKKVYVSPEIEELMAETQALMEPSMPVNDSEVGESEVLTREMFNQVFEF